MGSRERPLFDLNELPAEENEEFIDVSCFQPQRARPSSNLHTSELFAASSGPQKIINNLAFSHTSAASGFQPFVRPKGAPMSLVCAEQMRAVNMSSEVASLSKRADVEDKIAAPKVDLGFVGIQAVEKEEREWSDAEGSADAYGGSNRHEQSLIGHGKESQEKATNAENVSWKDEKIKDESNDTTSLRLDPDTKDRKSSSSQNPEGNGRGDMSMDGQEELGFIAKQREVKGVEASHALKCANNSGKRPRLDLQKEVMLGKKRSRQTMFLKLDDVKQVGPIKTSTPRRQTFPAPITIRTVKESCNVPPPAERSNEKKQSHPMNKDKKQVDLSCSEGNTFVESNDSVSECNGDMNSGFLVRSRRLNSGTDLAADVNTPSIARQSSLKQLTDSRQLKNAQVSTRNPSLIRQSSSDAKLGTKKLPSKKQATVSASYQDTSVERLLREVTNENFWHHPEKWHFLNRYDGKPLLQSFFIPLLLAS